MAGYGREAEVRRRMIPGQILNVCVHQKRSLNRGELRNLTVCFRPFPDIRQIKKLRKKMRMVRHSIGLNRTGRLPVRGPRRYTSALIAARVTEFLVAHHLLNHSHGIAAFRVEFERYAIVPNSRFVIAFGHDGLSERIPGVGG